MGRGEFRLMKGRLGCCLKTWLSCPGVVVCASASSLASVIVSSSLGVMFGLEDSRKGGKVVASECPGTGIRHRCACSRPRCEGNSVCRIDGCGNVRCCLFSRRVLVNEAWEILHAVTTWRGPQMLRVLFWLCRENCQSMASGSPKMQQLYPHTTRVLPKQSMHPGCGRGKG